MLVEHEVILDVLRPETTVLHVVQDDSVQTVHLYLRKDGNPFYVAADATEAASLLKFIVYHRPDNVSGEYEQTLGEDAVEVVLKEVWDGDQQAMVDTPDYSEWICRFDGACFAKPGKTRTTVRFMDENGHVLHMFPIDFDVVASGSGITEPNEHAESPTLAGLQNQIDNIVDATLSVSGKAADAKATGDEIRELKSAINSGLSGQQRQTLMDVINSLGGAFTTPNAQDLIDAFNSAWNVTVTGISLNKSTLSFSSLTSETLIATLIPSDATGTVTWTSSNTSVATVDSNGTVVVVGNGTATITASCGGYSATCAVTVSGIRTTYTVTYNLTGCVSSNPQAMAEEDSAFTTNITPVVGYILPFTAYTVTMGGTDITALAWSNGTVSIAEVTGAIVISATATVDSRTLLYAWDLTQSLVDTVENTEATLINTVTPGNLPTRDSNGLHFIEAGQVAQFVTLDAIARRVIEMDVASMDFKGDTSKHIRLLDNNDGNTAYSLLIRRNTGVWTAYENGWQTPTAVSGQTTLSDVNAFSGHTVSCEISSSRSMTVYVDGTPIYTVPVVYNFGRSIAVGGAPTGTQSDGQQIFDCTITGLRIYSI